MKTLSNGFKIHVNKNIQPNEFASLMASVGWGSEENYQPEQVLQSIAAYPVVAHCRDSNGLLVGYVSAFTDGAFSTFVGELVVRPNYQRNGIGSALLALVVEKCHSIPVYASPFEDSQEFFLKRGFRIPKRLMTTVSMRNAA